MNALREELRSQSPVLHAALERSWEVAFDEWLPAVAPNNDSFNSYPHIRNLENYLLKLIVAHGRRQPAGTLFSPLELYVLLVSILLHDIGKAGDRTARRSHGKVQPVAPKQRSDDHDKRSQSIIEANWAHLGVPCHDLALSIGRICGVHAAEPEKLKHELACLSTMLVDPFGPIRERELASVLVLIDHMDTSHLRTVADYVKLGDLRDHMDTSHPRTVAEHVKRGDLSKSGPILGAFRKKIRGVDVDLDGGLIKVVLGHEWTMPRDFDTAESRVTGTITVDTGDRTIDPKLKGRFRDFGREQLANEPDLVALLPHDGPPSGKLPCGVIPEDSDESKLLRHADVRLGLPDSPPETCANMLFCGPVCEDRFLLTMLLRDTYTNRQALLPLSETLSAMGLPIRDWRIEYREHLFEWNGGESFEPALSLDRMEEALEKAWGLSTQIFAAGRLSYSTLAAEMGEPHPPRIKMALRRLNVIAETSPPFWLSDTEWCWAIPRSDEPQPQSHAQAIESVHALRKRLETMRTKRPGGTT